MHTLVTELGGAADTITSGVCLQWAFLSATGTNCANALHSDMSVRSSFLGVATGH